MKFLANENFPLASVKFLREGGFDVTYVGHDYSGITDREVIHVAIEEERTILTFDRDYSELLFKHNFGPQKGVIYFRLSEFAPDEPGHLLNFILNSQNFNPNNALTVIDKNSIRQKKY
jgi:predicted nuclease of predicted toxin-antitoxin system